VSFFVYSCFYFGKGVGVRIGEMERTYITIYFIAQEERKVGLLAGGAISIVPGCKDSEFRFEVQCRSYLLQEFEIHHSVMFGL
jgi:hypothetical protein